MEEEQQIEDKKVEWVPSEIEYVSYGGEYHLPLIMGLVDQELSEPYSIFTYRYFVYLWPELCFLAFHKGKCVGTVVCKMAEHRNTFRGYIAMLVVIKPYRGKGIATELVTRSIKVMMESGCEEGGSISLSGIKACCCCGDSISLLISKSTISPLYKKSISSTTTEFPGKKVTLEAEVTNKGALALYGRLGFIRAKRLFRYYLNGVDAFRLKLLFPRRELHPSLTMAMDEVESNQSHDHIAAK
ncbi:hypothetical protein ACFE04_028595 [Oxalis oulophora]